MLTPVTEWIPDANRLLNHRPGIPCCRNLSHTLPHCHNLWPGEFTYQASLVPTHFHPLRHHLPLTPSDRWRHGIRGQSPGQEPRHRRSHHGGGIGVSGAHAPDVPAAVFGFLDQDVEKDEKYGRRRAGSRARGIETQCQVPNIFGRAGTGDGVHLYPICLSGRGIERGVDGSIDPEPTPIYRV